MQNNKLFVADVSVKSQIEKLFPGCEVEEKTPFQPIKEIVPALAEVPRNARLYQFNNGRSLYAVFANADDTLITAFQWPGSVSNISRELTEERNAYIFRHYINSSLVGQPRSTLVKKLREDKFVMLISGLLTAFFYRGDATQVEDLSYLAAQIEWHQNAYPISKFTVLLSSYGDFTVKGIPVNVLVSLRLVSKKMQLTGKYIVTPKKSEKFGGSLTLERDFKDFKWLAAKAFLREHEDLVYHWLRDMDKEARRLDTTDESNAI